MFPCLPCFGYGTSLLSSSLEKQDMQDSKMPGPKGSTMPAHEDSTRRWSAVFSRRALSIFLLFSLMIAGSVISLIMMTTRGSESPIDEIDTLPMNFTARLRSRGYWAATEEGIEQTPMLFRPAKMVIVAHTAGNDCTNPLVCENVVRGIQHYNIPTLGDIAYNFLIGGDGLIYEGRGWGVWGAHTFRYNCASLGIAFMGNYNAKELRLREKNAFDLILEEGIRLGELESDYKLFGHWQLISNDSPGKNIKKQIRGWKHFAIVQRSDLICPTNITNTVPLTTTA